MDAKRYLLLPIFAALPFSGLHAAPEPKPIPPELKSWARESLQEISIESSADALVAQLQRSPTPQSLLAEIVKSEPKSAAPLAEKTQPLFHLEFAIEYSGDLIPDVRLTLAKPAPTAVAPEARSEA